VAPGAAPAGLVRFTPIDGAYGHRVPATPPDAWRWISGADPDVTGQTATAAAQVAISATVLAVEQRALTYRGGRDSVESNCPRQRSRRTPTSAGSRRASTARTSRSSGAACPFGTAGEHGLYGVRDRLTDSRVP
jgi:hypothetical protein